MTLTFTQVRHPGDPVIYVAHAGTPTVHSYEVERDGRAWAANVLRPRQQLMGPLARGTTDLYGTSTSTVIDRKVSAPSLFAADMRFSTLRFPTLRDAQAACEQHLAAEQR